MAIFVSGNAKGGVGKTTVAVNLSAALATNQNNYRVCAIDFDFQCNLTRSLIQPGIEPDNTMYEILSGKNPKIIDCIYPTVHPRLDLIPSATELSGLEMDLYQDFPASNMIFRNFARDYLLENYDFVICDVGPNINIMLNQALCCADGVFVVAELCSSNSMINIKTITEHIGKTKANHNPDLRFMKLIQNKLNKSRIIDRKNIKELYDTYTEKNIFRTVIPVSTDFQMIEDRHHTTIYKYKAGSKGATAFRGLGKEVVDEYLDV